ncbi:helix-turn-helix domain-containing protein [Brenneria uluponensis]|uniref:helix-turn-helix domain-containing protein n=1 Tax=Brenneria uluponensis TaxID=3057057 RepID=UPI0028EBC1BB|nr:AraC family transcriptional regulator [Brenneria ulupoensis]
MSRINQSHPYRTLMPGLEAMYLASDISFPRHAHEQFGIGVIARGGHRSWSGKGLIEAGPGNAIMVNPGEIHDGSPIGKQLRTWRMLYFTPSLLEHYLPHDISGDIELTRPAVYDPILSRLFSQFFVSVTDTLAEPLMVEEHGLLLLNHVLNAHSTQHTKTEHTTPDIDKVRQRLDDAPEQLTSLAELAETIGISRFQLLRAFTRELGITPHAYLIQRRVQLARRLLLSGKSLSEAALDAGFADQSHMTRAFTRQIGVPPGRFKMSQT